MKKIYSSLVFICFVFPQLSLWAYSFTEDFARGIYWKDFPVSMRVDESDANERDRLEGFLLVAIDQWQEDQAITLWDIDYGNASKNIIRWSSKFQAETGYPESSTLGVTVRYNRGTYFERVEIILNNKIADLVSNKGNLLAQTVAHELAHTLGLGHTEDDGLMYPIIGAFNLPHADDLEGLKAVVDETIHRQDTNYVAPGTQTSVSQNPLGCGGTGSSDAASQGGNFFFSLLLGGFPLFLAYGCRRLIGKLLPDRQ